MKGQLRITEVYAFICLDEDGTEGIPAFAAPGGVVMPMLCADKARVDSLRQLARDVVRTGRKVELVRFSVREHVEDIEP